MLDARALLYVQGCCVPQGIVQQWQCQAKGWAWDEDTWDTMVPFMLRLVGSVVRDVWRAGVYP